VRGDAPILPLRLEDLAFAEGGRTLLEGIRLTLRGGPPTLVLGPNGAGKSLLLRLCAGLLAPTSGAVRWTGPGAAMARPPRHLIVFQRPVMLRRSAAGNIAHALAVAGVDGAERQRRAEAALDRFGLSPLAARPARALSGGEQQRLALARAWALGPQVVFLDEPTASLDPAAARAVEEAVAALAADGIKAVMTTHDLAQARRLAGDVAFLHRGRLLEHGPAHAFFDAPRTAEAAAFLRGELYW